MQIWERAIMRALASHLLRRPELRAQVEDGQAAEIEQSYARLLGDFRRPRSIYSQVSDIINERQTAHQLSVYLDDPLWDDLEDLLGEVVARCKPIYFYLDAVDEEFSHAPMYWLKCQEGLFYQVMRLLRDHKLGGRLHVVVCIRDIVMSSVYRSEHAPRYYNEPHIRVLTWDRGSLLYLLGQKLARLPPSLLMRRPASGAPTTSDWLGVDGQWPGPDGDGPIEDYLLSHTRLIPRDIISLGNELSEEVLRQKQAGHDALPPSALQAVVQRCAKRFGDSQLAQCANQISSDLMPAGAALHDYSELFTSTQSYISGVLEDVRSFVRMIGADRFARADLLALQEVADLHFEKTTDLASVLWQNGLLGYLDEAGRRRFYSMGDVEQFHFPPDVGMYVLHPCLVYAVGGIRRVEADSAGVGQARRTRPLPSGERNEVREASGAVASSSGSRALPEPDPAEVRSSVGSKAADYIVSEMVEGSGAESPSSGGGDRRRYLKGRCPKSISVGEPFGLLASVVLAAAPSSAVLKPFDVPPEGRDIRLEAYAPPGLRLFGHRLLTVHLPGDGDSEPVLFELRADEPGVHTISVTAWIDGSYLGELRVDITAEHSHPAAAYRDVLSEIATEPTDGAVSLVVRFDPRQNAYRFEFRDEDNPDEVTSNLAYEPGPRVEQLVASLEVLAKGRSGHDVDQTRAHLVNSGAALWHELVPKGLRDQFWERQDRIRQLTILADKDAVPWELLYPMDPGHDRGFLVEQFPVTRAIFGRRPTRKLSLWPARFVLPEDSLPQARAEIDAMRVSLDPGQPLQEVISGPTPLQNLIARGDFGLLHFACHNTYDSAGGSSIKLGNVPFTPTDMATAAINKALAGSAPTVFINACRSAGLNATYNRLDGWATKFLEAGAAAFIGSLWAVSDGAAREFAQELYGQILAGSSLGQAVKRARMAAASQPDDPTWLAYAVYGDPRATLGQKRPWPSSRGGCHEGY